MGKLHELLAVAGSLEQSSTKARGEFIQKLTSQRHLFEEKKVVFTPLAEGAQAVTEQQSDLQSTVMGELDDLIPVISKAINVAAGISKTNTIAIADIVLDDGTTLIKDVPATTLLELEKRIASIAELIEVIPTIDPAKGFTQDPNRTNVFCAREVVKTRTKKSTRFHVAYEATKEHPAQVVQVVEDAPVGTVREMEWSGLISPAHKAKMKGKAESLLRAVRAARSRANETYVQPNDIGDVIVTHIF